MKKSAYSAALLLLAVGSSGCPIYDSTDGCFDDWDCSDGYVCDDRTGACVATAPNTSSPAGSCTRPEDCGANETCSRSGTCVEGDCSFRSVGCVRGYECSSLSGRWMCEPQAQGEAGNGAGGQPAEVGAPDSAAGQAGEGAAAGAANVPASAAGGSTE